MQRVKITKRSIFFYCPACKTIHCIARDGRLLSDPYGDNVTVWGGSTGHFALGPVRDHLGGKRQIEDVCHFFIKNGKVWYYHHYLNPRYNNRVIDLVPVDQWFKVEDVPLIPGLLGQSAVGNTHYGTLDAPANRLDGAFLRRNPQP